MVEGVALGIAAMATFGLVMGRTWETPVERYGDSAAGWIEHLARIRALHRVSQADGVLDVVRGADGLYPPGLHLLSVPFSYLGGHDARSVIWVGLLSYLALGVAAAAFGGMFGGKRGALAAGLGILWIPALSGAATRYYYDLPMTSLVWIAAALGLWRRGAIPAVLVGAFAALVKWSALPLGLPIWIGLAWATGRWRVLLGALGALGAAGLALVLPLPSFEAMLGVSYQLPQEEAARDGFAQVFLAVGRLLVGLNAERLGFYPFRLAISVLSPVGCLYLGLVALDLMWRGGGRSQTRLWQGGVVAVAMTWGFLLVLPPLDDRFLLTVVPWSVVLLAPWFGRPGRLGVGWMGWTGVALGLWLTWRMHAPTIGKERTTDPVSMGWVSPGVTEAGSSVDRRGWSRSVDRPPSNELLRARLLGAVDTCGVVGLEVPDDLLHPEGDLNWWGFVVEQRPLLRKPPLAVTIQGGMSMGEGSNGPPTLLRRVASGVEPRDLPGTSGIQVFGPSAGCMQLSLSGGD